MIGTMRLLTATSTATIDRLAFAPDGSRLAAACGKSNARVWALTSGKDVTLKNTRDQDFVGFARSADEVVTTTWKTPASLHDLRAKTVRPLGPAVGPGYCWDTALSPDGTRLVRVERAGVLCRDLASGAVLWEADWEQRSGIHTRVCFDAAGARLFVVGRRVAVLDAGTGAEVGGFDLAFDKYESVNSAAVSPDGRWLAVRGVEGLQVRDTADGELVLEHAKTCYGYGLAFTPDGTRLVATRVGGQPALEVWTVAGWRHEKPVKSKIGPLKSVAFSPDGGLAAVGGYQGQVAVWDFK